jgi:Family of unknown function (DUF5956)
MAEADWGVEEPARSFGAGGRPWEPVHSDRLDDVPEVVAARALGFQPADEAPLWCFVPAIWPRRQRAWVRDCRVRHLTRRHSDGRTERLPWTAAEYADLEDDTNALLRELGLPPRPAGRIWLLRAPEPYASAHAVLEDVWAGWLASGGPATATAELVEHTQSRLRSIL